MKKIDSYDYDIMYAYDDYSLTPVVAKQRIHYEVVFTINHITQVKKRYSINTFVKEFDCEPVIGKTYNNVTVVKQYDFLKY